MANLSTVSSSITWLNVIFIFCSMSQCNLSNAPSVSAKLSTVQRSPAGYLNPELYREGIASLIHAKEQAEEMMYRNDVIAQLVTEMPYHDIQNRLLIAGNHKEANRSFFEYLKSYKTGNCGSFDVYKLLHMVQRSREKAMMETTPNLCTSDEVEAASDTNTNPTNEPNFHKPPLLVSQSNSHGLDWSQVAKASEHLLKHTNATDSPVSDDKSTPADSPLNIFKIPIVKNQQERVSSGFPNHQPNDDRNSEMISSIRKKPFVSLGDAHSPKINSLNSVLLGMNPKHQDYLPRHVLKQRMQGFGPGVNRSFFEKLDKDSGQSRKNCGHRFDIFKLLDMVQRSREMNMERDEAIREGTWTTAEQCTPPTVMNIETTRTSLAPRLESVGPNITTTERIVWTSETITTVTVRTLPYSLESSSATESTTQTETSAQCSESFTAAETCSEISDENESTSDTSETAGGTSTCSNDATMEDDVVRRMMLATPMWPQVDQQYNHIETNQITPMHNHHENSMNIVTNRAKYPQKNWVMPMEARSMYPNPVGQMPYQMSQSKQIAPAIAPHQLAQSQGFGTSYQPSQITASQNQHNTVAQIATSQGNKMAQHSNPMSPKEGIHMNQQFKNVVPYQGSQKTYQTGKITTNQAGQTVEKTALKQINQMAQQPSRVASNDLEQKSHRTGELEPHHQAGQSIYNNPPKSYQREESAKQSSGLAAAVQIKNRVQKVNKLLDHIESRPSPKNLFRPQKPFKTRIVSMQDKP